ncbi:MAG: helix-turn-helix transcriptional regulator [Lachnospiraceae bacterium]|nr:helix-turn-helix transcriptional regulator [Lachnospiraceae bacterium]
MPLGKGLKKNIFYILLFAVFLFTYMAALSLTDSYAVRVSEREMDLHYLPALTRVLGFLSFTVLRRCFKGERARGVSLLLVNALFLVSAVILVCFEHMYLPDGVMIAALFSLSASMGHLGGMVYYVFAQANASNPHRGMSIGAACSLAVLVQFLLLGYMGNTVQLITMVILFIIVSRVAIRPPADYVLEDALPYAPDDVDYEKRVGRQLCLVMAVSALCAVMAGRIDVTFSLMSLSGNIDIYGFPRLFMIPAYLIMGFLSDRRDKRLLTAGLFTAVILSVVLLIMPFYDSRYSFFLSVYYLFIGVYIFFYTYSFMSLAPRSKRPELWAAFGRPFSDIVSGIAIAFFMGAGGGEQPGLFAAVLYCLLLAALLLVFYFGNIDPNVMPADDERRSGAFKAETGSDKDSEDAGNSEGADRLGGFLGGFPLTPREKEVAAYLIEGNMPMKAIALELKISERSVYRYSASIYEKTGAEGRNELLRMYLKKS